MQITSTSIVISLFMAMFFVSCQRDGAEQPPLIEAIIAVESGGVAPSYPGPHGEVGILQITPIMVEEVNRILSLKGESVRFSLDDRMDDDKSIEMFKVYSYFWCDRTGDTSSEGIARRWNGGPDGHLEPGTLPYWRRVEAEILQH